MHQLMPYFPDVFVNRPQPIYRIRNYETLAPVLHGLGIQFTSDTVRALEKEEIGAAKKLLFEMKRVLADYEPALRDSNKTLRTPAQESLHRRLREKKAVPRAAKLESSLLPFEEEFLRQRRKAENQKQNDEQRYRDMVETHRQTQVGNLRTLKEYREKWEKGHIRAWKKTKQEQREVKQSMVDFADRMTQGLKVRESKLKGRDMLDYSKGIGNFEENANSLGIKLETGDGDKPAKKKDFNSIATMQRITREVNKRERLHKQKESRLRKIKIQTLKAETEMEKLSEERLKLSKFLKFSKEEKLQEYQNNTGSSSKKSPFNTNINTEEPSTSISDTSKVAPNDDKNERTASGVSSLKKEAQQKFNSLFRPSQTGINILMEQRRKEFVSRQTQLHFEEQDRKLAEEGLEAINSLKVISDEDYAQQCKTTNLETREMLLEKREEVYNQNYDMCRYIVSHMFELNEQLAKYLKVDEDAQTDPTNPKSSGKRDLATNRLIPDSKIRQIPEDVYYDLEEKFKNYEQFEVKINPIFETTANIIAKKADVEQAQKTLQEASDDLLMKYVEGRENFQLPLTYDYFVNGKVEFKGNQPFSDVLTEVLDIAYPMKPKKSLPEDLPLHLPLRILITGPPQSGKKTLAARVVEELGLEIIDVASLEKKATELSIEQERQVNILEEEAEQAALEEAALAANPKKKPAAKKGKKKGKQDEIVELTEEELVLAEIGDRIREERQKLAPPPVEVSESKEGEGTPPVKSPKSPKSQKSVKGTKKTTSEINEKSHNSEENDNLPSQNGGDIEDQMQQIKDALNDTDLGAIDAESEEDLNSQDQQLSLIPLTKLLFELFKIELVRLFPQKTLMDMNSKLVYKKGEAKELEEARAIQMEQEKAEKEAQEKIKAAKQAKLKKRKKPSKKTEKVEEETQVKEPIPLIDDLKQPFHDGYILVGLPHDAQAVSHFDVMMTNFVARDARLNQRAEKKREKVSRVMSIASRDPEKDAFPAFDIVISLEGQPQPAIDNLKKCQIDPETGEIYHEKTNPLPSNDKKLLQRIEDLPFDEEALLSDYASSSQQTKELEEWYSQFGWKKPESYPVVYYQPFAKFKAWSSPEFDLQAAIEELSPKLRGLLEVKYGVYEDFERYTKVYYKDNNADEFDDNSSKVSSMQNTNLRMDTQDFSELRPSELMKQSSPIGRASFVRKSKLSYSRKLDSRSVMTRATRQDKILKKCVGSMKKVMVSYIEDIQKCFINLTENTNDNSNFMNQVQMVFTDIMRRSPSTTDQVQGFIDAYRKFAANEHRVLNDDYGKEKLYGMVEQLHDFFWYELEAKKDKALKEKQTLKDLCKLEVIVEDYIDLYFKVMGCELNKIFYMKEMLAQYYTYKNYYKERGETDYNFELKKLDFVSDQLPEIDHDEILPLNRLNYIEDKIVSFFDDFQENIEKNKETLPRVS